MNTLLNRSKERVAIPGIHTDVATSKCSYIYTPCVYPCHAFASKRKLGKYQVFNTLIYIAIWSVTMCSEYNHGITS